MTAAPLEFAVERLRLLAYSGFWVIVAVGIVLTTYVTKLDLDDTLLMRVFGYNNICVYFDSAPSNQVLPVLWAFTLVLLLMYIGGHWLQMRAERQDGRLSARLYRGLSLASVFEACTLIGFSLIFAVGPEDGDHALYIHTAPFFLLQIGMVSLAISNTVHGIRSGYWQRLGLPGWFLTAARLYCVAFAIVVCFKIPAAINAMAGAPWWDQSPGFVRIAQGFDLAFLVCAAIVPILKAGYLVWTRPDRLDVVSLSTGLSRR